MMSRMPRTTASFEIIGFMRSKIHQKKRGYRASTRHPKNPKKPIENYILTVIKNRNLSVTYKGTKYNNRTSTCCRMLKSRDFLSFDNRLHTSIKWHVAIQISDSNFVIRGDAQIERAFVLIWVFMTIWTSVRSRITGLIFYVGS